MKFCFAALTAIVAIVAQPDPVKAANVQSPLIKLADSDVRIARIAFGLVTANTLRCAAHMPATGLVLHTLDQYGSSGRSAAMEHWTFPSTVSVEAVVPGSPADRAGFRAGDGILAIAEQVLPSSALPGLNTAAPRDQAELLIQQLNPAAPIRFQIKRGDQSSTLNLVPIPACRTRIEVVAGNSVRARSDGTVIQIGQAFSEKLDDGGVAVAIAHELAHSILGHRAQLSDQERSRTSRAARKALARQFEDEADLLSLSLLAAAGWDPALAPRFMRREGGRYDPFIPGAGLHRNAEDRAARMEQAIPKLALPK